MKKTSLVLWAFLPLFCLAEPVAPRFSAAPATNDFDSLIVVLKDTATTKKNGQPALSRLSGMGTLNKAIPLPSTRKKSAGPLSASRRRIDRMYRATPEARTDLEALLSRLQNHPDVEFAEPNYRVYPLAMPNDRYADEVWALNNTGQTYYAQGTSLNMPPVPANGTPDADIDWLEAYEAGFPTNEIIVAIVDTGVDYTHPDIVNRMWINPGETGLDTNGFNKATNGVDDDLNGYIDDVYGIDPLNDDGDPMDDHAHGTHCAGTIAAEINNLEGIAGVNPYAKIMACKFIGATGGSMLDAIECVTYAADHGAQVMNNSWGGGGYSQAMQGAINYANEKGVVFMAAAGNDNSPYPAYPAAYDGVTSVAASDSNDEKASFSNYGFWVDVMAPGFSILSLRTTHPEATRAPGEESYWTTQIHPSDTNLLVLSGTSMACPATAGAMSLLVAKRPGYEPWIYGRVMEASCDTNVYSVGTNTSYKGQLGAGRINLQTMLTYDKTNAFLFATLDVEGGFAGMVMAPGETNHIRMKAGAWTHAIDNLTVELEVVPESVSNLTLTATNYSIGTLSGGGTTNLAEGTFQVVVNEDAREGGWNYIRAKLMRGSEVLDETIVYVGTSRKSVTSFRLADLDLDGLEEIIGFYGNSITVYNANGSPLWEFTDTNASWGEIQDIAIGNVDASDPEPEIVVARAYSSAGDNFGDTNRAVQVISHDGENEGVAAFSKAWNDCTVALANMDTDPELEVVSSRTQVYGWPIATNHVAVYDITTNQQAVLKWQLDTDSSVEAWNMPHLSVPAAGDFDHDGLPDIACTQAAANGNDSALELLFGNGSRVSVPLPGDMELRTRYKLAAGDLNFDGTMEFVFTATSGGSTFVLAYEHDGSPVEGWPKLLAQGTTKPRPPLLADLDGDADLEVLAVNSFDGRLHGWHHDGRALPYFPIEDGANLHSPIRVADLDGDGEPEMVYSGGYTFDAATTDYSFRLTAREFDGTFLRGFPRTISGTDGFDDDFSIDTLPWGLGIGPLLRTELQTNAVLVVSCDSDPYVLDIGNQFDPAEQQWVQAGAGAQNTYVYTYRFDALRTSIFLPNDRVQTGVYAQISADVFANDPSNLMAYWDVDGDHIFDLSGAGLFTVSNLYSAAGDVEITLFVTNTVTGETWTQHKTITALDAVAAHFSGTPLSIPSAPGQINFSDTSENVPQFWSWDFGDGETSSVQHPSHLYTNAGTFDVTLTVSNDFGPHGASTDTQTQSAYITVGAPDAALTNHYVSTSGRHIYPFTSWEKAATNAAAAIQAATESQDHHVFITNGLYRETQTLYLKNGVAVHGINGAEATLLDGGDSHFYLFNTQDDEDYGLLLEGITIQHAETGLYGNGVHIRDCTFRNNSVRGVELTSAMGGSILLEDCLFEYNRHGAAWSSGSVIFDRNVFRYNDQITSNRFVLEMSPSGDAAVRNSLFYGNTNGGVLYAHQIRHVENLTITDNDCEQEAVFLSSFTYPLIARNLICVSNRVPDTLYKHFAMDDEDHNTGVSWAPVQVYNSYIDGELYQNFLNPDSFISNRTERPLFLDPAQNDYRLATHSPCIDDGYETLVATAGSCIQTARVDFGSAVYPPPANWNQITSVDAGLKRSDLTNTSGASTGFGLSFSADFHGIYLSGVNTDGLYPANVTRDGLRTDWVWTDTSNSVKLVFSGLSTTNIYSLTAFGSSGESEYDGLTVIHPADSIYVSDGEILDTWQNTSNTVTLANLVPESDGTLKIELEDYSQIFGAGVISALELFEFERMESTPDTNRVDAAGRPRLTGAAIDVGAYENQGDFEPIARFSATPDAGLPTLNVTFDAAASTDADGSITHYLWDFGDGTQTAGSAQTAHSYSQLGLYRATLTVQDNSGYTNTASKTITVQSTKLARPENLSATTNATPTSSDVSWQDLSADETGFVLQRTEAVEPIEIILDNDSPYVTVQEESEAPWETVSSPQAYGGTYLRQNVSFGVLGLEAVTYAPPITEEGLYNIYVWHPESDEHLSGAWMRIYYAGGIDILYVNQQVNGGQWVWIGTWPLGLESTLVIDSINSDPQHYTVADAVKFERAGTFATHSTLPSNTVAFTDSDLTPDMRYFYRIAASNSAGLSSWSEIASVTLPATNHYPTANFNASALRAYAGTRIHFDASASTDSDGALTHYAWNCGDNYSGSIQEGASLTNISYVYDLIGTFTVSLVVSDNLGDTGSTNLTVIIEGQPPSSAPTGLSAQADGTARIVVSWNDASFNEDGFELQRDSDPVVHLGIGTENYSDTDVSTGSIYSYRVRATNGYGASAWAGPVNASLDTAAYALPFSEPFEATNITTGVLNGQHGWTGGGTVQNSEVHGGAQALSLAQETASHTFIGEASNVWITLWAKPVFSEVAPDSIDANASAVFYVNASSNLVAYSNTTPVEIAGATVSNGWNKFEIECDYSSKVWNLSLNNVPVVGNFAFYGSPASFQTLELTEASRDRTSFFDTISVSDSSDDSDSDGLPDRWEESYYGDLSHSPGDLSSNGVDTVYSAYIAGFDPTDPNARFALSNRSNILWWNAASGRVYTVYWTSNLLDSFQPLETNYTGGAFTDSTHGVEATGFYKIDVRIEK